jgi:uncharacterized protein YjbI with pentapeptide repeats
MANEFRVFLDRRKVFEEPEKSSQSNMRRLASEPLLLYLFGTLHRNGALTQDAFETSAHRIEIYDRVVSWVCGDTRKYHAVHPSNRILKKSGMKPYELRQLLQEIALCVWHKGGEFAPITSITRRLNDSVPEQMRKLTTSGSKGVHNLLVSFSFEWHEGESGNVEFLHKSFGEYLIGEKIGESLRQISECTSDQSLQPGGPHTDYTKEVAHRFYSVFGVALLTERIWDFVITILTENFTNEEIKQITEQLYHLYIGYSDGRWMNEGITRMRWDELKIYEVSVDLLQFEAQTGINLFVLLCLLYRQIEDIFEICGREDEGTFDSNRFRKLLAFGEIVETFGLFRRIHHLLKKVSLQRANLLCANFRRANLQETNLQGAILRDMNLRGASLQGANLQGADLRVANLQDADLRGASLQNANMEDADLRDVDFRKADVQGANLLCADLRDADLRGANLQRAVLYGANLRGVILEDADVTGAIISIQHLARYRSLFSENQIAQLDVVHD